MFDGLTIAAWILQASGVFCGVVFVVLALMFVIERVMLLGEKSHAHGDE